jgi:hypothetical protein
LALRPSSVNTPKTGTFPAMAHKTSMPVAIRLMRIASTELP